MLIDNPSWKDTSKYQRLDQGIYCGHFAEWDLSSLSYDDLFPEIENFNCYGVVDSPQQLKDKLPKSITDDTDNFYVIIMRSVFKDEESCGGLGGWRWHKWGPYIGNQIPTTEYLCDEPLIEEVWTYHIYNVSKLQK